MDVLVVVSEVFYHRGHLSFFFFQAEDGIRDAQESRGLGDVYKRQMAPTARYASVASASIGTSSVSGPM